MSSKDLKFQAEMIADSVSDLSFQQSDDSEFPKIFLPEVLMNACSSGARAFTLVIYKPYLDEEYIQKNHAWYFFLITILSGYHAYCKEHSFLTNKKPYSYLLDYEEIERIRKKVFYLDETYPFDATALGEETLKILAKRLRARVDYDNFMIKGHKLRKGLFNYLLDVSMYMGYNFAKETIVVQ